MLGIDKVAVFVLGAAVGAAGMWGWQRGMLDDVKFQSPVKIETPAGKPVETTEVVTVPYGEPAR